MITYNGNDKYVMKRVMISVAYLCIILHICFSFKKPIYSRYLNKFKLHHLYVWMYVYICV